MGLEGNMWRGKSIDGEWVKKNEAKEINYNDKDSYDCLFTDLQQIQRLSDDRKFIDDIDDDDKAAILSAREESTGLAKALAESELSNDDLRKMNEKSEPLWKKEDLGRYTINTPIQDKKSVEEQDKYMQPVSELEFQEIADDVDLEDAKMQKKFEEIAKQLEEEMGF